MTTEELVTLIELRQKFKCEISEEDFHAIRPLESDPEKYDIDVVDGKLVKRYTSKLYEHICDDVAQYCMSALSVLRRNGYVVKSYNYLDYGGNIVNNGHSCKAQRFSVVFTNTN
jgi:hypothetical protein